MKFNFDLSTNPYSSRRFLDADEQQLVLYYFKGLCEVATSLPPHILSSMASIAEQFEKDKKLSDKQIGFICNIYEQYCKGEDKCVQ